MISKLPLGIMAVSAILPLWLTISWVGAAEGRLIASQAAGDSDEVARAAPSDASYCNVELKRILRRVLQSCGLLGKGGGRGCKPAEAKNVATVSGTDFNSLFLPMKDRGGIVQYDSEGSELDTQDQELVESVFADQRGASYFFVVARASPDGEVEYNRNLSKNRAEAVMQHLQTTFNDPDLEREVGLLWLGEEFAQLDQQFCEWRRSGETDKCSATQINRGAFIAWIDCAL